jgi:hypothetical protein
MEKSSNGRAVIAVQEIIALVTEAKKKYPILAQYNVNSVSQDDMVFLARQILDLQDEFKAKNLPSYIDIGYHYTNQNSMPHIRTNGLLTKADRESQKVTSTFHGSVFGDGIYTAQNPIAFSNYGNVGLLVARLQGKAVRVARSLSPGQSTDVNTIIGDKMIGVLGPNNTGPDG